jgi:hypothetical protein
MATVKEYLRRMNATPEDRDEVLAWIREGHDYMSNGDNLADEYGRPMDFISASCAMEDICERYESMTPEKLDEALHRQHTEENDLLPD